LELGFAVTATPEKVVVPALLPLNVAVPEMLFPSALIGPDKMPGIDRRGA
jgi:hypothetical protein